MQGDLGRRALLAASLAGCAGPDPLPAVPAGAPGAWVVSLGWHTEVVLDLPAILPAIVPPGAVGLSFGARDYFTSPAPGLPELLSALVPGPAVVLVAPRDVPPRGEVVPLALPPGGREAVARFLAAELARDAGGRPVAVAPGFTPGAIFLAATRRYAPAYTCNAWTLDLLAAAGLPVSGDGIVTAGAAMAVARRVVVAG